MANDAANKLSEHEPEALHTNAGRLSSAFPDKAITSVRLTKVNCPVPSMQPETDPQGARRRPLDCTVPTDSGHDQRIGEIFGAHDDLQATPDRP